MKLIIKLSPEITIKSQSVRLRFIKILTSNIRTLLKHVETSITVLRHWDHIEVRMDNQQFIPQLIDMLIRIPGIHHILSVEERSFKNVHDISEQVLSMVDDNHRLVGKSFCVRVRRRGKHSFTSQDIERYVGRDLNQKVQDTRVNLTHPEEIVRLEIKDDRLLLVNERYEGLGGFPIGTQDDVLSLISGGFDSGVSSYMMMRRGCRVNYCFFNLVGGGGVTHDEMSVRAVAHHLWNRFGRSHKVRFLSINFNFVVNEMQGKINNSQIGVVLKRMMVRAASIIADRYGISALVTGEALGQVSSQTLVNLSIIDTASNIMILRPIISYDKEQIIMLSRHIGTEVLSKNIPEYCGVISHHPTARAVKSCIEKIERNFNFSVLHEAIAQAQVLDIREILIQEEENNRQDNSPQITEIETTDQLNREDIVLDLRTPEEQENHPLNLDHLDYITVKTVPFYKLVNQYGEWDKNKSYLLYCTQGFISRFQAVQLRAQGFHNVKVYRPSIMKVPSLT